MADYRWLFRSQPWIQSGDNYHRHQFGERISSGLFLNYVLVGTGGTLQQGRRGPENIVPSRRAECS